MAKNGNLKEIRLQVKGRIEQYAALLNGMSMADFCRNAGLQERYFSSYTGKPNRNIREKFANTYPALNMDWLFFGRGEMIKKGWENDTDNVIPHPKTGKKVDITPSNDKQQVQTGDAQDIITSLLKQLEKKDVLIEFLMDKIREAEPSYIEKAKGLK